MDKKNEGNCLSIKVPHVTRRPSEGDYCFGLEGDWSVAWAGDVQALDVCSV